MKLYDTIVNLLPPNISSDKHMMRLFGIFCDLYDETYQYSQDAINAILIDKLVLKFEMTKQRRYSLARKRILRVFLNEFFEVVEKAQQNDELYQKMADLYDRMNLPFYNVDFIDSISSILKEENIISLKNFNYLKGKLSGYLYVFDIIEKSKIQGVNLNGFLRLIEGTEKDPKQPFYYRVETSMFKECYYSLVHPLVHPIGFGWAVLTILEFYFEDFFSSGVRTKLLELKIKCLLENGEYEVFDLMEMYNIENFKEEELNGKKRLFCEFTTKEKPIERRKIVSNFDNSIVEYSLDDLKLYDISLKNELDGRLSTTYDENGALISATYNQFFINRKKFTTIYWRIQGDVDETVYSTDINIDINSLKKVPDDTIVEGVEITPEMLIELCKQEVLGRTYKIWSRSCGMEWKIEYEYYSTMSDDLRFIVHKTMWDFWCRRMKLERGKFYIAAYNHRNSKKFWQPVIDEFYFGAEAPSIYASDYRNHPELPTIDDLGWKTGQWMFEELPYDREVPYTDGMVRNHTAIINHPEAEFYPAWEAFHGTEIHDVSGWNVVCPQGLCLIGGHTYKDKDINHIIGEPKKYIGTCNQIPCRWERGDKLPAIDDEMVGIDESGFALVDDNDNEQHFLPFEIFWYDLILNLLEKAFPNMRGEMKWNISSRFLGYREEKLRCYIGGHYHDNELCPKDNNHYHFHFIGEKNKFIGDCKCEYPIEGEVFKELMDIEDIIDISTPVGDGDSEGKKLIISDTYNTKNDMIDAVAQQFGLSDEYKWYVMLDSFNYGSKDEMLFGNVDIIKLNDEFEIEILEV